MKKKLLTGLIFAGVLSVSGAAFADLNVNVIFDSPRYVSAITTQKPTPPDFQKGKRPEMPPKMSRDFNSKTKPPKMSDGKRPPMSMDKKMPPKPHSGDRRPPEFNGKKPEMPKR